jgi:hypothetical protein
MSQVLIHIGYSKAGSSYLKRWFLAHPDMYYRAKSVAGFYTAEDIVRYAQKNEKEPAYFVLSSEHISVWRGDYDLITSITSGYNLETYHQRMTATLHDIFAEPYVLIVTRGFSGVLRSLYAQYVRDGGILSFEKLNLQYSAEFSSLYDYTWLIQLYRQVFGAEKVIVLPFELLQNHPAQFIGILQDKLGLQKHSEFTNDKVNPSLDPKSVAAIRRFSAFIFAGLKIFPRSLQTKIYNYHLRQIKKKSFLRLIKLIAPFYDDEHMIVTESMLSNYKGKAEILRSEPLYQGYLKDYLLD